MEDRAQLLRRFRRSLGITMHASSGFDVGCDSRSTISPAALGPQTKPWCTSGNHASGDRRPSFGKGWRRSARLGWIHIERRLRRTCPRKTSSMLSLLMQRKNLRPIGKPWATSQDGSVKPRYTASWRGVMQVGLIKVLREPASSISPCRRTKLRTFFEQAGSALCCEPRKVVRDMPVGLLVVRPTHIEVVKEIQE